MKNIATSTAGNEYFIFEVREELGAAWGRQVVDGKIKGATRRLKLDNLTFIGTATRDNDGVVSYVTAPKPLAFAMEMPALNGDVVTQGHADYCADNGHATHTNDGVVSPWCPRCGGSINPAPNAAARAAALADAETPAKPETVFVVTSSAPGEIALPAQVEAALEAIHTDLMSDGSIFAPDYSADRAPKFNVHLRPAGEGIAAFWHDATGNGWRIEFADADRNVTELVAFEWQDLVDEHGRPIMAHGQKLGGRWHAASTMTRRARIAVERAGL